MIKKYWINSNNGDYISESDGKYTLNLIPRFVEYDGSTKYLSHERIHLTKSQFFSLKGFIPIKEKKLFSRSRKNYSPTLSDGSKGDAKRTNVPSESEVRDELLKSLGL